MGAGLVDRRRPGPDGGADPGTDSAYTAAMATQLAKAQLVLTDWQGEAGEDQSFMTAGELAAGRGWPAQLSAATTPG